MSGPVGNGKGGERTADLALSRADIGWGLGSEGLAEVGVAPQAPPISVAYPALLLLLLGVGVLAAAGAGVAGDAVETRDAV